MTFPTAFHCYHARGGGGNVGGSRVAPRPPAGYKFSVRLVCCGDIHMAFHAIERLAPALATADAAILTGDLTHFGDPPDAIAPALSDAVVGARWSAPAMSGVRAVTFDAAGTLIAPAEPVGVTYARLAARHGIVVVAADLEPRFRHALANAPPLAFGVREPAERVRCERAWWRALVAQAFGAAAEHPAFTACFKTLFAHYGEAAAWHVFPDVAGTLGALRARGLRLAVVSNFDGRLPGLLTGLGLAPLFDAIVFSAAIGSAKPAAEIFHQAAAALGVPPREIVHVGDDPGADVAGARAAAMQAVLIDRSGRRSDPPAGVRAIATLGELVG